MSRMAIALFALVLAATGLALLAGGALLIGLGGSPYYLAAGLLVSGSVLMLVCRRGLAVWLYAALLVLTLVWSLWEVGLDGWALAPRLLGPAALGALFLALPVQSHAGSPGRWWLGAPVLACLGTIALAGMLALTGQPSAPPRPRAPQTGDASQWSSWGGAPGGGRFSPAAQITPENVGRLELAWRYDPDLPEAAIAHFEVTPLAIGDRLYACLDAGTVVALDQLTGREIWRYATRQAHRYDFSRIFGGKCRGVSYYRAPAALPACTERILFASPDGTLRAIDAADGKLCRDFGSNGAVDLHAGMEDQLPASRYAVEVLPSSPPAIVNGIAVVGQTVSDLASLDAPSGVIRGYDALTGRLLWAWSAGMKNGNAYVPASPNAWAPLSADEELGLVFAPLGNSPPDYFGGMRRAELDAFATAVVALEARTGKLRWHFRTVNHDLWDYDLAAQPTLADLPDRTGRLRKALLVPTKLGQIFVLDRITGEPIDPVEQRKVPQGGVPGERIAPTQPFTTGFPQLGGDDLTERDMWGLTPLDQMWCRIAFLRAHYKGRFTPVTQRPTLMYPGTAGGINWGGVAIDPLRGLLVVNTLHFANLGRLVDRRQVRGQAFGGAKGAVLFGMEGTPWIFAQSTFMSPLGVPCQRPPYGRIHALDLKTRK
ncbi:MAG: PQQ-binding-like beta-propeller repeat protein, partial [Novosphingobium sp.]|nr:PQQ-binding-like beta-propeller repeat protein [Novosphingobium sp.]